MLAQKLSITYFILISRESRENSNKYPDESRSIDLIHSYIGIGIEIVSMNTYAEHLMFVPNIYSMIDDKIKEALLRVRI